MCPGRVVGFVLIKLTVVPHVVRESRYDRLRGVSRWQVAAPEGAD